MITEAKEQNRTIDNKYSKVVRIADGEDLNLAVKGSQLIHLKEEDDSNLLETLAKEYHEIERKLKTL